MGAWEDMAEDMTCGEDTAEAAAVHCEEKGKPSLQLEDTAKAGQGQVWVAPAEQQHHPELEVSMGKEGLVGLCSPAQLLGMSKAWAGNLQIGSELASLSGCKTPAHLTLARTFK